ncbi:UDP-glucuronosyl/UDP-glucosyltransferase [Trema orientale]|uniref:UDP-glucuronosyl/UDP-glucosyltransferase n=1 Tax=Trema orientale TaxID=63057 RepID=A0A2P5FCH8_TREOI|nr:UDP-glucuronosyl/UDP-glucosyltransferase [Trema orientale]
MVQPRFLLVTFPTQGSINPTLHFADQLIRVAGAQVTYVTTVYAHRLMMTRGGRAAARNDLSFVPFSDGYDDGFTLGNNTDRHAEEFKRRGSQALAELIESGEKEGRPYTCIVYTLLLSWAADVAAEHGIPAAMLWAQPATVFDLYYYYFHGYGDIIREYANSKNPNFSISFPGIALVMSLRDLPSFFDDSNGYSSFIKIFQQVFEDLDKEDNNTKVILVNTFDELEPEALRAIGKLSLIGIGPLIPSAFLEENKEPLDSTSSSSTSPVSFQADLFQQSSRDYIEWLNSKPKTTVVYVSFGTLSVLSKPQMEEIAKGLLEFGRPFLWVIREKRRNDSEKGKNDKGADDVDELSCREELDKLGMIVPWCYQMEVLSNESIGCFVTHCGWNSTLESFFSGVPVVAFPQWTDQGTNAKLVEEVWKTGVRVKPNEDGIVRGEEIKRCLELVMGGMENGVENGEEKGEEVRRSAQNWKGLAKEAVREGGSSTKNLKAFLNERSLAYSQRYFGVNRGLFSTSTLTAFTDTVALSGTLLIAPFLWVIRGQCQNNKDDEYDELSCGDELDKLGMIVPCSAVVESRGEREANHPGCAENVRVKHNEDGIVGSEEIKRCLDLVTEMKDNRAKNGEENREETRRINDKKWKDLAREAIKEGGSSHENLKAFVNELITGETLFLSK